MIKQKVYYLAIQHYGIVPKVRSSNIPFKQLLDNWIEEYGLDFIEASTSKQEATDMYMFNYEVFGENGFKDEEKIEFFEKCLQLECK